MMSIFCAPAILAYTRVCFHPAYQFCLYYLTRNYLSTNKSRL